MPLTVDRMQHQLLAGPEPGVGLELLDALLDRVDAALGAAPAASSAGTGAGAGATRRACERAATLIILLYRERDRR